MNATIEPRSQATTYVFEYGTTTAYGNQIPLTPASAGSGSSPVAVDAALTGLNPGTTIHYRVVAANPDGSTSGADRSFRTLDPPVVTTDAATGVTSDSAILNATLDTRGQATTYVFEYGTTTAYGDQVPLSPVDAGAGGPVSVALDGLAPGATIHYRLVATNADGTTAGGDSSFTTLDPPRVTTGATGAVTSSEATLTGTVDARGKATTFKFEYGTSTAYGSQVTGAAGSAVGAVSVGTQLTGLTADTVYHYRLTATNADGTSAGEDRTLRTGTTGTTGTSETTGTTGTGGTTGPTGGGGASTTPPPLTVAVVVLRAKLRTALAKGLRLRVVCGRTCTLRVMVVLPAKLAKRLHLRRTIGSARRSVGAAPTVVSVRLSRKARRALARLRRVPLTVSVAATSADGGRAAATRRATVQR
jgi:phosphodiesterase/alkaline phosphatase D-like protein